MLLNHLHDNTQHLNHLHVNTPAPLLYESCMGRAEGPRRSNAAVRECNGAGEQEILAHYCLVLDIIHFFKPNMLKGIARRHTPYKHWLAGCWMKNWAKNLVSTNFVFQQHVLDNIFKHLHPIMHVNRTSPVLFRPSCNHLTIEFRRPRLSLCRISFTRPKQHSPVKSYVQGKPCTCSAPNLLFLPLTNERLCVEPDTVFHRTKAAAAAELWFSLYYIFIVLIRDTSMASFISRFFKVILSNAQHGTWTA